MSHYKSNVRDLSFMILDVLETDRLVADGPLSEWDAEMVRQTLAEAARLAEGPLADSFADSDRIPPVFDPDTSSVTLPETVKRSYRALRDAGWWRLDAPPALGGIPAPRSLSWAITELILGANPVLHLYLASVTFAATLHRHGTKEQALLAEHIVANGWGATMVLTESDAGSDVGAAVTRAVEKPDGTWHITGVKRFITSAEHDLAENIVHLVLARPHGARPGTKGLSLFVVPKYHVDLSTGAIGARNGVYATNLERKMGVKGSTTCELRFGEREPAVGWLVGDVHDGIAQMFDIIEHTRMMVGTKAIATLSTGYLNALEFARNRVQSADLTRAGDKTAPPVTIVNHPEVRRRLMLNKAYVEGLRALLLYTAHWQDKSILGPDGEAERARAVVDLLLPVVKGAGSERSYEQLTFALQTLGGSGYLQDYPLEQYIRDVMVDTLYEGTTPIQANDFFFRKIARDRGTAFHELTGEIAAFVESIAGDSRLDEARLGVRDGLRHLIGIVEAMLAQLDARTTDPRNAYKVGQNALRLLLSAGDLLVGYLLLRQAAVALARLESDEAPSDERDFYQGKVAVARFFARTVLPELAVRRSVAEDMDNALMDVPEGAF